MNATAADTILHYLDDYSRHREELPGAGLLWLARLRDEAMARFVAAGFPTLRDEDWKYTNVAPIAKGAFSLALAEKARENLDAAAIEALALPDAHRLVFVDGRYAPRFSHFEDLPPTITVASLAWLLESDPERIAPYLRHAGAASRRGEPFSDLNLASLADGAYLHLAAGAQLEAPIQLLFVARSERLAAHTRNVVVAGKGSRAVIVETHAAIEPTDGASYFTNSVSELRLARGAHVEHHKLQDESGKAFHVARVAAELSDESHFVSTSCAFGGALSRTDIGVDFAGEDASCALDGLYLADGRRHVDHHTRIAHARSRCSSREFYKGILAGAGRAVFNGKVIVQRDAQQSDASQTNRNLLLSDQAEIDTKPQLEIWADDVKCSHAATAGQLDAEQIFYLRSRGIAEALARDILTDAFAGEIVDRIELAPLRERVRALLRDRLATRSVESP
jgi:Fe-S cluster assembly protein SufD